MTIQGGYGITCKITVSATMTAIANIVDIAFPMQDKVSWEATAHDDADDHSDWVVSGLRGLTEFAMTLMWDDTQTTHSTILAAFNSDDAVAMNIADPDGQEVIAFSAHVRGINRVAELKGGYTAEVMVQPTGAPTIGSAAAGLTATGITTGAPALGTPTAAHIAYDYYIDWENGNDTTGDGSLLTPWKTLSKALTSMSNGESVGVKDGTYEERNLTSSLNSITIAAMPGHNPIFSGADHYTSGDWSKTGGYTNVYEAVVTSNCWFVYNSSTRLTSVGDVATCDSTANSYYFDDPGDKVYANIGGGAPTEIQVLSTAQKLLTYTGAGLTLEGLDFQWYMLALDIQDTGAPTMSDCEFRYCSAYAITYYLTRWDGDGGTISDCTFTPDNRYGSGGTGEGIVAIESTAANYTVDGVTINGPGDGDGVNVYGGSGHTLQNLTVDGLRNGVRWAGNASGTLSYSLITDCTHGFVTYDDSPHTGTVTSHHLLCYLTGDVTDNGVHGIIHHSTGTINEYHIVIAWLKRSSTGGQEAYYFNGSGTFTIKNCVAFQCNKGMYEYAGSQSYDLDYNSFYGNNTNYENIDPGDQGSNDVTSDPTFVDAANNDFHPDTGSPLFDAGTYIAGVSEYGPPTDIGRWET